MPTSSEMLTLAMILLLLGVTVAALIDVTGRQFGERNTKLAWVLIILLLHGIGAAIYFIIGRKQGSLSSDTSRLAPLTPSE